MKITNESKKVIKKKHQLKFNPNESTMFYVDVHL